MKIWVRGTAVHEGKHSKHSAASTTSLKISYFRAFPFWPLSTGRKSLQPHPHQAIPSTRLGTFHHTLRGISKPPERRVQKRGLLVSSSTAAPQGVGEALLPFVLLPMVTRDIPWGREEMGERTEMCSSYTEQQLGKQEGMGLNPALTTWFPRSGLACLNNWQNHGA